MENQFKKQMEKSNTDHAKQFQKVYNSSIINVFKHEINAYLQNKKQKNIKNELEKLRLGKLVNNNISERDLVNIKELIAYPLKTLQQIAKLRNINSNMSKGDIIYALICSEPIIHEEKYLSVSNNEIHSKINDIWLQLLAVSPYINKKKCNSIRKRLYDIEKTTKIDISLKKRILKELNSISSDLRFLQKNMISDNRDDNYANIDDIEYIFGDIYNYYAPTLTSSLFNNGY